MSSVCYLLFLLLAMVQTDAHHVVNSAVAKKQTMSQETVAGFFPDYTTNNILTQCANSSFRIPIAQFALNKFTYEPFWHFLISTAQDRIILHSFDRKNMPLPKRSQAGDLWVVEWQGSAELFPQCLRLIQEHKERTYACSAVTSDVASNKLNLKWSRVASYNSVSEWLGKALKSMSSEWALTVQPCSNKQDFFSAIGLNIKISRWKRL